MWMAPNLVTLIGLFFNLSSFFLYLAYDLSLSKQLPPYFYIWTAVCLFMYQTLDAIDGKQARRTGTSSPLGQLFDHGIDALATCLNAYVPLQIFKIGPDTPTYYFYMVGLMGVFFTANWEEYHLGVLRCSMTLFGIKSGLTES
jgi:phosphatidylglycerophosphate synthase